MASEVRTYRVRSSVLCARRSVRPSLPCTSNCQSCPRMRKLRTITLRVCNANSPASCSYGREGSFIPLQYEMAFTLLPWCGGDLQRHRCHELAFHRRLAESGDQRVHPRTKPLEVRTDAHRWRGASLLPLNSAKHAAAIEFTLKTEPSRVRKGQERPQIHPELWEAHQLYRLPIDFLRQTHLLKGQPWRQQRLDGADA